MGRKWENQPNICPSVLETLRCKGKWTVVCGVQSPYFLTSFSLLLSLNSLSTKPQVLRRLYADLFRTGQQPSLAHQPSPHGLTASENHSENMCLFSPALPQPHEPSLTKYTKDGLWSSAGSRALCCRTAQGISVLQVGHAMANLAVLPPTWIMSHGHLIMRLDQSQQLISHESLGSLRQDRNKFESVQSKGENLHRTGSVRSKASCYLELF